MKIINLGSGSKGNATLIKIKSGYILVDCGLHGFKEKLKDVGVLLEEIKYVFITHNHRDHILNILSFDPSIVYCGMDTIEFAHQVLDYYKTYNFGDFEVTTLKTSHDAPKPYGYIFKVDGSEVVYITDTGKIPAKTALFLKNRRFYIMESNYDLETLMSSNRPLFLKNRIKSTKGHLSNVQAQTYLKSFIGENTIGIALAHISEECNDSSKISAELNYFSLDIKVELKQWEATEIVYDEN